jgi:hypothetical protein
MINTVSSGATKIFPISSLTVDIVFLVPLYTRICYRHKLEALAVKLSRKSGRIWKSFLIPGKGSKTLHMTDIQIQDITRDVTISEFGGQLQDPGSGFLIHPPAVMVTECPTWRQRVSSRELCKLGKHQLEGRPGQNIVTERSSLTYVQRRRSNSTISHLETTVMGVIEINGVCSSIPPYRNLQGAGLV